MKFENTEVWGFKHAIRGMLSPMNSWESDSLIEREFEEQLELGKNDIRRAQTLIKAGSEHRKFLRQIFVSVDITAPLYWWKGFDAYKEGTVANSTSASTMHKLISTPITKDSFEMDDFEDVSISDTFGFASDWWDNNIYYLEELRQKYNKTKDKHYWKELIRLLPESWLQKITVTMNYENILNMLHQTEWSGIDNPSNENFITWVKTLPYANELLFLRTYNINMEE